MINGDYILIIAPKDFPGKLYRGRYCYEHHYVYWKNTGIIPNSAECIHHINGNKHDNMYENLSLITRANHAIKHARPTKYVAIQCAFCGKLSEKKKCDIDKNKKRGQKDFYCNRHCMAKDFGNGRPKY